MERTGFVHCRVFEKDCLGNFEIRVVQRPKVRMTEIQTLQKFQFFHVSGVGDSLEIGREVTSFRRVCRPHSIFEISCSLLKLDQKLQEC